MTAFTSPLYYIDLDAVFLGEITPEIPEELKGEFAFLMSKYAALDELIQEGSKDTAVMHGLIIQGWFRAVSEYLGEGVYA